MKKKLGMLLLVPAVTLSLAACGNDDGKDKDGKVTIKTTQKDILSASKSDLFMYTGDNLDPVAKKVASTIKDKDKKLSLED
ncbi:zinc ABC transporter substrate-binding protein, partial [Staphylococcus aureus]|nr:zinc ABC transporter substrate-binding protein [Staphylococcus aureus]